MKEVDIISKVVGRGGADSVSGASLPSMAGYALKSEVMELQSQFNDFLEGEDTDVVINRWNELVSFLNGLSESDSLFALLGGKADKATTLAGYGITDAYTKSAVDNLLGNYVTLKTVQTITGEKDFTGGLKVNGSPIVYDATNKYWKLEGDLLVTGGITMFASDSDFTPSTIMDAIATDGTNLKVVNGVLTFVGSIDGGEAGSVAWENVEGKPSWIGASKPSYAWSEITGKPSFASVATSGKYSDLSGAPTLLSSFTNDVGFAVQNSYNDFLQVDEFNFVPDNFSGHVYINYRSPNANAKITQYNFRVGNASATHANIRAGKFIADGGNSNNFLKGDGSLDSTSYLPSSAYTASDILAKLKTVDGEGSGLDADLLDGIGSKNFIYQSVVTITSADDLINQNQGHLTGGLFGAKAKGWNNIAGLEDVSWGYVLMYGQNSYTSTSAFAGGGLLIPAYGKKAFLLETSGAGGSINIIPHRILTDNIIGNYNAGSATKLQTARTIWGQSFDGAANVSGDLVVGDGDIYLKNTKAIRLYPTSGSSVLVLRMSNSNNVAVGSTAYNTYLDGVNLYFRYGNGYKGMILNSSGNVGIGTDSPSYKLDVVGDIRSTTNVRTPIATIDGIPIYKSQDDVLYIDGNLAVRGGITMYATDAIDVPSIIEALPSASSSAKGIAAFNPNDFSVVDGYVSFIGSSGGVDESVLTQYAKKTDLSGYLPLNGGQMTGNIGYTLSPDSYTIGLPAAGYFEYSGSTGLYNSLAGYKSFLGSAYNIDSGAFFHVISVRHRNGLNDGNKYGLSIIADLNTEGGNLKWNKTHNGTWMGERVILDSVNWSQYISVSGSQTFNGTLTINGSDSVGSYPALRLHIPNVNWQQFIMRGDGTVILTEGGSQNGAWGRLAISTLLLSSTYNETIRFAGGEYMNKYGNFILTSTTDANSWNVCNSNVESLFAVYGDGKVNIAKISFEGGNEINTTSDSSGLWLNYRVNKPTFIGYGGGGLMVGVGSGTLSATLHVIGSILSTSGITMYSDIRKKTKLKDVELSLKQIADAPLIEHFYNSDAMRTTHVGSIAQYWAGLNDWFCKLDSEGFYTMEIQNAALASAISIARELVKYESKTDKEIRLLKDEVKRLKKEIKILKST